MNNISEIKISHTMNFYDMIGMYEWLYDFGARGVKWQTVYDEYSIEFYNVDDADIIIFRLKFGL